GRRVGEHYRDRVAAADAALLERRGEPPGAGVEVGVVAPELAVDDRGVPREHARRALEEAERCQRLEVRRIAVEIDVVGRFRHWVSPLGETLAGNRASVINARAAISPRASVRSR